MDQEFSKNEGKPQANVAGSQFWNERFRAESYVYGTAPNAFFKATIDTLPPGSLLLPAEGEGRNAVYAARMGWQVDALDFSAEGRKKALKLAKESGVSIHYDLADVSQFTTDKRYDLIAFLFFHQSPDDRRATFQKYISFLRPGGQILVELFTKQQLGNDSGGPKNLAWLVDQAELADIFGKLEIEYLEELETVLSEGAYHEGKAHTVRMIARRR